MWRCRFAVWLPSPGCGAREHDAAERQPASAAAAASSPRRQLGKIQGQKLLDLFADDKQTRIATESDSAQSLRRMQLFQHARRPDEAEVQCRRRQPPTGLQRRQYIPVAEAGGDRSET